MRIRIQIQIFSNVYPDPAFFLNADPDPGLDLGSQTNVDPDPDPGQT